MADEAVLIDVISNLRACLLSAKGGVSFVDLNGDYEKIVGKGIPFKKLGFPTLEAFLQSIPGLVITRHGGDWNIAAKPTEETAHITKMIARQKSAPKKRSRGMTVRNRRPIPSSSRSTVTFQTPRSNPQSSRVPQTNHRMSQRTTNIVPLMAIPQKPPRFLLPNPGMPQISPSKRRSDRLANNSQSANSQNAHQAAGGSNNQTSVIAYKNKAAVQASLNDKTGPHASTLLASPVATGSKVKQSKETSSTKNSEVSPLKRLSERLKVKPPSPPPAMILSPLSPIYLVSGAQNTPVLSPRQTPTTSIKAEAQTSWPLSPKHQDACQQLEILSRTMKLPEPVYKISTWNPKKHQKCYGCLVKVGVDSYKSYPEEIATPEEARKVAAAKAVKELLLKDRALCGLLETRNKDLVKKRVIVIVAEHQNGVFMHQIPTYYKEQYRENLPEEWEKIIEECSEIFKEKGAHDSTILCPKVPRFETNDAEKTTADVVSPRMEKIQLNPIGPPIPGILKPPTEQYWDVCITSVLSTVDLWARLIGEEYSEKFEIMLNDMESYYKKLANSSETASIESGNYYAVQEEESWHRVQCFDFDARTGKATVFFIDHGDEDTIHYSKLFPLEKRFCAVPAQAVNVCLADLEEFGDCHEVIEYLEEILLGQTLVAQIVSREKFEDDEIVASVVLYDTKNATDVNLNEVLLEKICHNILAPKLNQEGRVSEVYVSHATETGDVYLHVKSESMRHLVNLINKLIQTGLTNEVMQRSEAKKIDMNKIYFARSIEDGNWYRGIVRSVESNNRVKVFLVDMGKTIIVEKKIHLLVLEQLSEVLARYPCQALKVRLHNIPDSMFNIEMAEKLIMLAPPEDQLLANVVTPASRSACPIVELFKRVEPKNYLVSINHNLAVDPDLLGSNGDGNNNTRPKKRLERTISRHRTSGDGEVMNKNLKPPTIPDFGGYFDVHITMAANPGNFTVQPYDDRVNLEAMMVQLQEACTKYTGSPLSHESIKEGNLYAAKHFDGHFYRVCISKIINDQMVTVYFCDFGDVSVLTLDKLQPLGRQFLDLPYQAIRARLVGIQPLNIDWSVEDCLRFQELVVERNFVSIVVDSGPDRLSPADTVLGLKLIDVSGDSDVYLDKLFVAEGRATVIDG